MDKRPTARVVLPLQQLQRDRGIVLKRFKTFNPLKIPVYMTWVARLFVIAKDPVGLLRHYAARTSPAKIELRNGTTLVTSDQPHDVITFIVVFVKRDYGHIAPGSTVVDIGANIGMFAVYAALEGAAKIYAFEPNPNAFATLKANVASAGFEGRIMPVNLAVSGASGETVAIPLSSSPYNQTVAVEAGAAIDDSHAIVSTTSLGDFVAREKIGRIDLLKMDCEGAEYDIVPSLAPDTLRAIRSVRMEVHGDTDRLIALFPTNPFRIDRREGHDLWMTNMQAAT